MRIIAKKLWARFEREHFARRIADESVIAIFLDDTEFIGIPSDIVGIHFAFDPKTGGLERQSNRGDYYEADRQTFLT